MKLCTKCRITKPFDQFSKQSNGKFGLKSWCKQCVYEHTPSWIEPYSRKLWEAWRNIFMRTRYKLEKYPGYWDIEVHESFYGKEGFFRFAKEVGEPPDKTYSIHRKDNDKNYEPGNIEWADKYIQATFKRRRNNALSLLLK